VSAPGIEDVVAALRTSGDTNRALAALRRRDDDLHRLSLKRLHGSARLHSYLQTHSPGAFAPPRSLWRSDIALPDPAACRRSS
jgi:hypothetical protein